VQSLEEQEGELRQSIEKLDTLAGEKLEHAAEELRVLRCSLSEEEDKFREAREALIAKESALVSLREQIEASSPMKQLQHSSEQMLQAVPLDEGASLLADGLDIPEQYCQPVQAVLGEKAAFLVCENAQVVAQQFVESVADGSPVREFGVVSAGSVTQDARLEGVPFPCLLDCIHVDDKCGLAAGRMLGRVFVAPTLREAIEYFEGEGLGRQDVTLVTLAGELVNDISFCCPHRESGLLQLKRREEQLDQVCQELRANVDNLEGARSALADRVEEAEQKHAGVMQEVEERKAETRQLGGELGSARGRLQAERALVEQLERDIENVDRQVREGRVGIGEFQQEEIELRDEMKALEPDDELLLQDQVRELQASYEELDQLRRAGRERLSQCAELVEQARAGLDEARSGLSGFSLELQRLELELGNLEEKVLAQYGNAVYAEVIDPSEESRQLDKEIKAEYTEEVRRLRSRILREGEVDPESIDRLHEEQQRLDHLTQQTKDLEKAAAILKETIGRLTETSKQRFLATFEAVRENFSKLVPRLFGGGKGSLELSDPNQPLESGLEIIVRPPGKKLKSMELLSGGEKALCATALIVAMFIVRPSPLCILDEVDAPLDDANLARFLALVKELSSKTQFILITHNKQSMAICNSLVGVTMEEPGATAMLSVSLQEAYSQVA